MSHIYDGGILNQVGANGGSLTDTKTDELLFALDIPQADNLDMVRRAMLCVKERQQTAEGVANELKVTRRHAHYCLNAARILGWTEFASAQIPLPLPAEIGNYRPGGAEARFGITKLGLEFVQTTEGSDAERSAIASALLSSSIITRLCPEIVIGSPDEGRLAENLAHVAGLAASTAKRRAQTIIAWHFRAVGTQTTRNTSTASNEASSSAMTAEQPPPTTTNSVTAGTISVPATQPALVSSETDPLEPSDRAYLRNQLEQARLVLLTGASFGDSIDTEDGGKLGAQAQTALTERLWKICYPSEPPDNSSRFADLLSLATQKDPSQTTAIVRSAFSVGMTQLPTWPRDWTGLPWARIYTLSVDNLFQASQAGNARKMAESGTIRPSQINKLVRFDQINGAAADGTAFRTPPEPVRQQLEIDLLAYPFLFAGSEHDQDELWSLIERRGRRAPRGIREHRPKSYLLLPSLSRARQALLSEYNVVYIKDTPENFARHFLASESIHAASTTGHAYLTRVAASASDSPDSFPDIQSLLAQERPRRTEYLMGEEPTWSDLQTGRAIERDVEKEMRETALAAAGREKEAASLLAVGGTAASGKTTALMRLGLALNAAGHRVTWIDRDSEASPRALREYAKSMPAPILVIDSIDRYGSSAPELIDSLREAPGIRLIIIASRSGKLDSILGELEGQGSDPAHFRMPPLTDSDIGRLLDALERDHRLGQLKGMTRAQQEKIFREKAGRILLVAMIEATLGRRFEERIVEEWSGLPARSRLFYTYIVLASRNRYALSKDELLLATESTRTAGDVAALESLRASHIIALSAEGRFRARHGLIAEKLFEHFKSQPGLLASANCELGYAVTRDFSPGMQLTKLGRFIVRFINYRDLFHQISVPESRNLYSSIEQYLHWDYHFWLQRGSLEVAEGDISMAEQFLGQARGLCPEDNYVLTEWAYLLMKKATANPNASQAETWLEQGVNILRGQIATRGRTDWKPFHVLGSQALTWARSARLPRNDRIEFLKGIRATVSKGVSSHPQQEQLTRLDKDMQRRILELETQEVP